MLRDVNFRITFVEVPDSNSRPSSIFQLASSHWLLRKSSKMVVTVSTGEAGGVGRMLDWPVAKKKKKLLRIKFAL